MNIPERLTFWNIDQNNTRCSRSPDETLTLRAASAWNSRIRNVHMYYNNNNHINNNNNNNDNNNNNNENTCFIQVMLSVLVVYESTLRAHIPSTRPPACRVSQGRMSRHRPRCKDSRQSHRIALRSIALHHILVTCTTFYTSITLHEYLLSRLRLSRRLVRVPLVWHYRC